MENDEVIMDLIIELNEKIWEYKTPHHSTDKVEQTESELPHKRFIEFINKKGKSKITRD